MINLGQADLKVHWIPIHSEESWLVLLLISFFYLPEDVNWYPMHFEVSLT